MICLPAYILSRAWHPLSLYSALLCRRMPLFECLHACFVFSTARKRLFCCNHLDIADIAVRSKLEGNDNGCPLKNTQCCVFHISVLSGSGFAVHLMRKALGPLQPVHLSLFPHALILRHNTVHLSSVILM